MRQPIPSGYGAVADARGQDRVDQLTRTPPIDASATRGKIEITASGDFSSASLRQVSLLTNYNRRCGLYPDLPSVLLPTPRVSPCNRTSNSLMWLIQA